MSPDRKLATRDTAAKRLAGPRSLERGEEYVEWGAVGRLRAGAETVAATVQGTNAYEVRIGVEDGKLGFACSCPVGSEGAFCKHCAAVALCWLSKEVPAGPTPDEVRAYLLSLDRERLVDLLMEHAGDDERLGERLHRLVVRHASGAADVAARAMIDRAFTVHGFVGYRDAYDYFAGIDETVDAFDELLAGGRAEAVIELTEQSLRALALAIERVDDSGGWTHEVVERLEELHHQACLAARPDPAALAERLLAWELEGDLDIFDRAAVRYADVLGEAGLARYRDLAEERWAAVPELRPGLGGGGLEIGSAETHPFAAWEDQWISGHPRYVSHRETGRARPLGIPPRRRHTKPVSAARSPGPTPCAKYQLPRRGQRPRPLTPRGREWDHEAASWFAPWTGVSLLARRTPPFARSDREGADPARLLLLPGASLDIDVWRAAESPCGSLTRVRIGR